MSKHIFYPKTVLEMTRLSADLWHHLCTAPQKTDAIVVVLEGDLGTGKTTLVQGILAEAGATPPYPSPTFTLCNYYDISHTPLLNKRFFTIAHIDAYRITADDLPKIGWNDLIADPQVLILLEWPSMVSTALPKNLTTITITHQKTGRTVVVSWSF